MDMLNAHHIHIEIEVNVDFGAYLTSYLAALALSHIINMKKQ